MAEIGVSHINEKFSNISVEVDDDSSKEQNYSAADFSKYGLPLSEVYKLALNFYKEKGGKAVHFNYEDKLQLVAFSQQVTHGPYMDAVHKLPPLGTLDVVGKDRRLAWQKLGQLSSDQARTGFIELLSRKCSLFSAYIEAHRREKSEIERRAKDSESDRLLQEQEKRRREEEDRLAKEQQQKEEAIKRQIQQALNEQTYNQFRQYAEQQYPGDPEKQGALVRQLQEQHYVQYIQQLQAAQTETSNGEKKNSIETNSNNEVKPASDLPQNGSSSGHQTPPVLEEEADEADDDFIQAPSMWTIKDIDMFKQRVSEAEGNCVVKIKHGETITVKVPTQPQASRLVWEFATDDYDIGFGIYFQFGDPQTQEVSVEFQDSDDEDIEDRELHDSSDEEMVRPQDVETGAVLEPLLTEIVPVYRRNCFSEVYAGSHVYPGQGTYLLKFDNSYSLWRSKTLYYKLYYTS